jgi:FMN phosphatase YigB (HAD superfamily)
MIRVAVFDLDNTVFDSTTIPHTVVAPAMAAARAANTGVEALPPAVFEAAISAARRLGFLFVAQEYGIPTAVRAAWRAAYRDLVVETPLRPYPDVVPVLSALNVPRLLLTTGFRRMQESKIAALEIAPLFDAIYIDALDGGGGPAKQRLLAQILRERALAPHEMLVVGDSAENEIAAGNALGAITVQILRPGIVRTDTARHHVTSFAELPALIERLGQTVAPSPPESSSL